MSERTVLGNYILLNKSIGRGAFSKIYAGYTLFSNKDVPKLNFFGKVFQNLKYLVFGEASLLQK